MQRQHFAYLEIEGMQRKEIQVDMKKGGGISVLKLSASPVNSPFLLTKHLLEESLNAFKPLLIAATVVCKTCTEGFTALHM